MLNLEKRAYLFPCSTLDSLTDYPKKEKDVIESVLMEAHKWYLRVEWQHDQSVMVVEGLYQKLVPIDHDYSLQYYHLLHLDVVDPVLPLH